MKPPWYFSQDQQTHLTTDLKQAWASDFGIERLKEFMLCFLKDVILLNRKHFKN